MEPHDLSLPQQDPGRSESEQQPGMALLPPLYSYRPFGDIEYCRILRLLPPEEPDVGIVGQIIHVSDLEQCEFEALSWCWSSQKSDRTIFIRDDDGQTYILISQNLESALRALRCKKARNLWIDKICINQDDTDERNKQVQRMSRIYRAAMNVCVWLGDADESSARAICFLRDHARHLSKLESAYNDPSKRAEWTAVVRFMQRPWFYRRWVVQEIALAKKGILYCGQEQLEWHEFVIAVSIFVDKELSNHILSRSGILEDVSTLGGVHLVQTAAKIVQKSGHRNHTLEYLVSRLSMFENTQPRDTIYSLLSLATDVGNPDDGGDPVSSPPQTQKYPVDYNRPVVDVYADFIQFAMARSAPARQLDILFRPWAQFTNHNNCSSSAKEDQLKIPSWIPCVDDQTHELSHKFGPGFRRHAECFVGMPIKTWNFYEAGGSNRATQPLRPEMIEKMFQKRRSGFSLFLDGFVLGTVDEVWKPAQPGCISTAWLRRGGCLDYGEIYLNDFWRILVADRGPNGKSLPVYYEQAFSEVLKHVNDGEDMQLRKTLEKSEGTHVAEFLDRVESVTWGRSLIQLKDTSLGLAPGSTKKGDRVCILKGCSVPVILRPVRKTEEEEREHPFNQVMKMAFNALPANTEEFDQLLLGWFQKPQTTDTPVKQSTIWLDCVTLKVHRLIHCLKSYTFTELVLLASVFIHVIHVYYYNQSSLLALNGKLLLHIMYVSVRLVSFWTVLKLSFNIACMFLLMVCGWFAIALIISLILAIFYSKLVAEFQLLRSSPKQFFMEHKVAFLRVFVYTLFLSALGKLFEFLGLPSDFTFLLPRPLRFVWRGLRVGILQISKKFWDLFLLDFIFIGIVLYASLFIFADDIDGKKSPRQKISEDHSQPIPKKNSQSANERQDSKDLMDEVEKIAIELNVENMENVISRDSETSAAEIGSTKGIENTYQSEDIGKDVKEMEDSRKDKDTGEEDDKSSKDSGSDDCKDYDLKFPGLYFWHVVGECYVHEMMEGDAIRQLPVLDRIESTFELR